MSSYFYERIRGLPVVIESLDLEPITRYVSDGFQRTTTQVILRGLGTVGIGEDLTFQDRDQQDLLSLRSRKLPIIGAHTMESVSDAVTKSLSSLPVPTQSDSSQYRTWAFESAALDLAIHQRDSSLAALLGREQLPLNFVVSLRLGEGLCTHRLEDLLRQQPDLRVKLDVTSEWTPDFMEKIAVTEKIAVLDFKAFYRGTRVDQIPDSSLYEIAVEVFPHVILEDLDIHYVPSALIPNVLERLSYDEPIRSVYDVCRMRARHINIKPARIGSLQRLFELYDHCLQNNIEMYGGGLFELGAGRMQIQYLASIFHANAPNDVAPAEYNFITEGIADLPPSPLQKVAAFGVAS